MFRLSKLASSLRARGSSKFSFVPLPLFYFVILFCTPRNRKLVFYVHFDAACLCEHHKRLMMDRIMKAFAYSALIAAALH